MKYTCLITVIHCSLAMVLFAKSGSGQSLKATTINLKIRNQSLTEAFNQIEAQTTFKMVYNSEVIKKLGSVSYTGSGVSVESALNAVLPPSLDFEQVGVNILITKKPVPEAVRSQTFPVTGKVVDEAGLPLPGVTVRIVGTNKGAVTDVDGNFIIQVSGSKDQISLSFIGYKTQTITVGNNRAFNIRLEPNPENALEEVVVVAFNQKQRKVETLGAQSSLNVQELKQPVANITTVLAGRVSGLVGVQRSAEPGLDNASLWIRGVGTMDPSRSQPLFLVDGVQREFNNIDPNDIESFTILKDASSTSVYGVRGANGVILITTKKGKAGRTNIEADYYQGITNFTRVPEIADGITYMQMANEAMVTRGQSPRFPLETITKTVSQEDPLLYPNVNWFDQVFSDFGSNRKANLSMSGGSDRMTYRVSASYYDEKGLFKTDELQQYNSEIGLERYNFTSSVGINLTKTTKIDLGIKGWITDGNYPGTGTEEIFRNIFRTYPILYPTGYYPDGSEPFTSTGGRVVHPYGYLTNRGYVTTYGNQLLSDINVTQNLDFLVKGLSARVLYSFDATNDNRLARTKTPATAYIRERDAEGNPVYSEVATGSNYLGFERTSGGSRQFYLESALNYNGIFGKHRVGGLLLYNQQDKIFAHTNTLINSLPYRNLGMVGRANYSFDDRYLLEASFGYNGAENFHPDKRFGFFPSVALGWVPSNEKFYGNFKDIVGFLKFRASYGLVGSSDISGRRFAYIATVGDNNEYWFGKSFKSESVRGIDIADYAANVTWETEKNLNLAVELSTFRNALNVQVDVFRRERENIFLSRGSVPSFVGLRSNLLGNLGVVHSNGVDISADFNKRFGELTIQARGTYTYNTNKIIENDQPVQAYPYQERRGTQVGQRFGYIADGYYTQEEIDDPNVPKYAGTYVQAGDIKYRDLNGNGVIDANDTAPIGTVDRPKVVYGFGTSFLYKRFALSAFFQGVDKVDIYLASDFMPFINGAASGNLYSNITDRWTEDDPRQDAFYPRLSHGGGLNRNYAESSHWLQDGKFLRLKTLDFSYTLPKGSLKKYGVQQMRLYFIGYNLLTFSPYKLFDPELGNGSGIRYPNIKTFSLGINATF